MSSLTDVSVSQADVYTVDSKQLPEPAIVLNKLKQHSKRSKATLKDVELIIELILT